MPRDLRKYPVKPKVDVPAKVSKPKVDAKQIDPVETLKAKARLSKLKKQLSQVETNIDTSIQEGKEDEIDGLVTKQKVLLSEIEKVEKLFL